jgi:hypothetical protein
MPSFTSPGAAKVCWTARNDPVGGDPRNSDLTLSPNYRRFPNKDRARVAVEV